ncbi:hypothetical protein GCM10017600_38500 [Streptosporangium carneum]|uniref:Tyr recombinase domain-containing protein n=1 Tax=Streptosporangium carneum TaxID=47481 RepID=A0A9W6I3S6_9ACTN|nr:hypothetical protein GCM10017600_38500 [Streptosporangium carneum]
MVLLATFGSLRWGELAALRRRYIDLEAGTVRVVASTTELKDGSVTIGPLKSAAGTRTVALPEVVILELWRSGGIGHGTGTEGRNGARKDRKPGREDLPDLAFRNESG